MIPFSVHFFLFGEEKKVPKKRSLRRWLCIAHSHLIFLKLFFFRRFFFSHEKKKQQKKTQLVYMVPVTTNTASPGSAV